MDRACVYCLGRYLHNDYDSIMTIRKFLQITYMRNNEKQSYVCRSRFFFFLRYTEVAGKILANIGYSDSRDLVWQ